MTGGREKTHAHGSYQNHGGESVGEIIQVSQEDHCRVCDEVVRFEVEDGRLVAVNLDDYSLHEHQGAV